MWCDLHAIAQQVSYPWCILGDFNVVLYKEDKIEGNEVQDSDVREVAAFVEQGDLQEMRSAGGYYS